MSGCLCVRGFECLLILHNSNTVVDDRRFQLQFKVKNHGDRVFKAGNIFKVTETKNIQ